MSESDSAKSEFWSRILPATKYDLEQATEKIMAKLSELSGTLNALADNVDKIKTEFEAFRDTVSDVDLPPEAELALTRLTTAIGAVDDLNPDAPTP